MRRDQFINIAGFRCLLSSERIRIPADHASAARRSRTDWSVYVTAPGQTSGDTIARGTDKKTVIARATAILNPKSLPLTAEQRRELRLGTVYGDAQSDGNYEYVNKLIEAGKLPPGSDYADVPDIDACDAYAHAQAIWRVAEVLQRVGLIRTEYAAEAYALADATFNFNT